MTIEADLYTLLTASTSVTAAVGTKLRPGAAKQADTLPYVVYDRVSTDYPHHLKGGCTRENTRVAFDCFANTFSSAQTIADALEDRLHGKTGTVGSTVFDSIFVENRFTDYIPAADGSDTGTHVASITINAWHAATVPSSL